MSALGVTGRLSRTALVLPILLVATAAPARACPLAMSHGWICKYADPQFARTLSALAQTEAVRYAGFQLQKVGLAGLTGVLLRVNEETIAYDATLRAVKHSTSLFDEAFAAAFNVMNTGKVRLVLAKGRVLRIDLGELVSGRLRMVQRDRDPAATMLRGLQGFGARAGGALAVNMAQELEALLASSRSAVGADSALAAQAVGRAQEVRRTRGDSAEARAEILTAQASLDHLRAWQEEARTDGVTARLDAIVAAQRARRRDVYGRALRDYVDFKRPGH